MVYEWVKKLPKVTDPYTVESAEWEYPLPESKISTMDKKVIIEAAVPGWLPVYWWRDRGVRHLPPGGNGGPNCIQEQVDATIECVKAGASVIHVHPRHPSDGLPRLWDPDLLCGINDQVFSEVDCITAHHTWTWDYTKSPAIDYISHTKELLKLGKGNKYVQTAMIVTWPPIGDYWEPVNTDETMIEGVKFYEENHIKPMFSVEPHCFHTINRLVFKPGIAKRKPFWIALQMGKHRDDQQFADPWSYLQVINNMSLVRSALPEEDIFLGIHPGGRNWLPASVMALLYGAQIIRLGVEDQFFLWPHKDDIPQKASENIELIVKICKALGREVATVKEAREIAGIELITRD